MTNYSKILYEAYEKFLLPLGGKKVPTPYRINLPSNPDPTKQGKSSPEVLIKTTKRLAKKQGFNLDQATVLQIQNFMRRNKLGIDCSGFAYRMLNYLMEKVKGQSLTSFGFPHVGRCNVSKLTSSRFAKKVSSLRNVKSGDLIRLKNQKAGLHIFLVLENGNGIITYTHSSGNGNSKGIHIEKITNGKLPKELDGIWRLKVLG